jgi:pyruvate dehydrogenase E1 component alpha subunit
MPQRELQSFSVSYLQILDEAGQVDPRLEPDLSKEELIALHRAMVYARAADDRMLKLQRQGRLGTFGPCTGQEAATCGATFAMGPNDWFVGAFRELGGRLMRGEPLANYYRMHNGWEEGNVFPQGRSRVLPYSIIVGAQLPHAVGIAYQVKYRKEKETAVVCFFGDGATSQGDFHEALNFASVWQVPVVFVCQNNGWAISLPRGKQTNSRTIAQKAIAYDMPGVQVDGNDPLAVYRATREALQRAYSGGGPTLIEAVTYRMLMHTTSDDPTRYRADADLETWRPRDPLTRFEAYLRQRGIWDDQQQADLQAEIKALVDAAVQELESAENAPPDVLFEYVLGTRHALVDEQRAEFLASLTGAARAGKD